MSKQKLIKVSVVVIVAVIIGFFITQRGGSADDIEYTTETITRGNIENLVVTTGTVKAVGTVEVGSQISGQISELYVDFNSEVKTGDLLAQIDPRTYEGRLKQSEAQLEIAKANVIQQQASLVRARADFSEAERLLERQQRLRQSGLISESEMDSANTAFQAAKSQVTIVEAQLANAEANITQAEASLFQARIDLERCTIRSPVDGVVINRSIELGQTVAASMSAPVLFTIAQDLREMQVEASVDEADIGKVEPEQPVTFTVEAFPDKTYRGWVKQVRKAATAEQNVVTYTVIVSADNRDNTLLPDMTATVEITTGKKDNVLRVPNTALRFRPPDEEREDVDPRMAFLENRIQMMKQQLDLSTEQENAIRTIFQERMANFSPPGSGGPPGGFRPPSSGDGPSRRGMFDNQEIEEILSEEQYREFRRIAREGGNRRGGPGAGQPTPGEVWLMTANGKLEHHPVLTGLNGDEFSELINADQLDGASVVVRARRTQNQ